MEVTFIDRFKNEPKHLIVSLRELTYYLDEWPGKNSKKHKTIQLFHPIFGKINISEDDIEAFKFNELELHLKSLKK